jgi:hypothetical protein
MQDISRGNAREDWRTGCGAFLGARATAIEVTSEALWIVSQIGTLLRVHSVLIQPARLAPLQAAIHSIGGADGWW